MCIRDSLSAVCPEHRCHAAELPERLAGHPELSGIKFACIKTCLLYTSMLKADGDRYDTQMIGENAGLVLCECHVYVPQELSLIHIYFRLKRLIRESAVAFINESC